MVGVEPLSQVASHRVLDLDHLRTHAGHELGGVGERLHLLDGQDANAIKRLAVGRVLGSGDVADSHGLTSCP